MKRKNQLSALLEGYCPHCYGKLNFNVETRKGANAICPYCNESFSIKEAEEFINELSPIESGNCPLCNTNLEFSMAERSGEPIKCAKCDREFHISDVSKNVHHAVELKSNEVNSDWDVKSNKNIENVVSGGTRFLHLVIDYIVIAILFAIIWTIFFAPRYYYGGDSELDSQLYGILFTFLYYWIMESVWGTTMGKILTGSVVVDNEGNKPSAGKILGRTLCRFIPFDVFSFLSSNPIGWHDSLSGTKVVKKQGKFVK